MKNFLTQGLWFYLRPFLFGSTARYYFNFNSNSFQMNITPYLFKLPWQQGMYSYYFPCDQASSFLARFFQDPYFKIRKKKMNYGRKVIHCSLLSGYCYQQMVTNISWKEKRLQCHQGITWRETTKCQALLQWRKQKKQEQVSFPNTGHICLLHSLIIFTDS